MNFTKLKLLKKGPLATVSLARPDVHNAFDADLIRELTDVFSDLAQESSVRVVVLRGEGKNFCAGADIQWMKDTIQYTQAQNQEDAERMHKMLNTIYSCPIPVIARVQGVAFGGGVGLISCADVSVAASDAKFSLSEVRLGILPAAISPFVMRKIGVGALRSYGITAKKFEAADALRMGLVQEVTTMDELDPAVNRWVQECLQNAPQAMAQAKKLYETIEYFPIDRASKETTAAISKARVGAEGQEGLKAFLEKRNPSWRSSTE